MNLCKFLSETYLVRHLFYFKIKLCKTIDELYELVDRKQLTTEFGGSIHYRHQEWIEQRQVSRFHELFFLYFPLYVQYLKKVFFVLIILTAY